MIDRIKGLIPFFVSALIMGFIIIIEFVTVKANDEFNFNDFLMPFVINSAILIIMLLVWRPSGKDSIRNNPDSSYNANATQYSTLVSDLNTRKYNAKFKDFCKAKTSELLQSKQEYILNKRGVTWEEYNRYLDNNYTPTTKKQKRVIEKVRCNKIQVKEVNPLIITTDSLVKKKFSYGIEYNEIIEEGVSTFFKVLQKLLTSLVYVLIMIEPIQDPDNISSWTYFVIKFILIVISAWGGFRDGEKIMLNKNNVFKRRIKLLDEFFEGTN